MNVICCQLDTAWEDKSANHDKVRRLLDSARPTKGSLVVLSEMFATGFSMNVAGISDSETRETQNFLARTAADYCVYVLGGVVTTDPSGRGRNECVVWSPEGMEIARYCKMQPFTLGGEAQHYVAGAGPLVFPLQEFNLAPFICYDLRFPEIFRSAVLKGANLYTVIASWPVYREHHWMTLLKARAIENQAYVVGVNRCGKDPLHPHSGRSLIVDPRGEVMADAGNGECTISAELDLQALISYREQFPFLKDIRAEYVRPTAD
ncbi:MAG TPA: nitrilase-related carbon-nitrogen hydrolase [Blastocatellia bacterium]|nr:nitrilase-related carbon-nitrogen hydrolase [Blastocatellia bacterium]